MDMEATTKTLTEGTCDCGCGFTGQQFLTPGDSVRCQDARDAAHRADNGWTPTNSTN